MTAVVEDAVVLIRDQVASRHLAPLFGWGAAGVVAMMLRAADPTVGVEYSQIATAAVKLAFGVWASGCTAVPRSPQPGSTACRSQSSSATPGCGGRPSRAHETADRHATLTGWWTTYAMYLICWSRPRHYARFASVPPR